MRVAIPLFLALVLYAEGATAENSDAPVLAKVPAGSNIRLTEYPAPKCQAPTMAVAQPKSLQNNWPSINEAYYYNKAAEEYNDAAKAYNAQMAVRNSCVQIYTANANADLHRIRDKLVAALDEIAVAPPSETQSGVGSNIGLTDYPAATCVKPSEIDMRLKPSSIPSSDANNSEINSYNQRVTRYSEALNRYNSQTASYNSCIQTYIESAKADMQRIQSVLNAQPLLVSKPPTIQCTPQCLPQN